MRLGAVIAVAVAAAFVAWLVIDRTQDSRSNPAAPSTGSRVGPVAMAPAELKDLADELGHPVYWAGPRVGYTYELTKTRDGKVYIRYLPEGVKVGDPRSTFLIIATYPFPNAFKALKDVGGGRTIPIPADGTALVDAAYPKSVHVAYPKVDYQVEVYDASPRISRQVAVSGQVQPVG